MSTPENPPAFPKGPTITEVYGTVTDPSNRGMTLRDYFAAKATEDDVEFWMNALGPAGDVWPSRESCKFAYADAMLAAREEGR